MFTITPEALVPLFEQYAGKSFDGMDTITKPDFIKEGRESGLTIEAKIGVRPEDIRKHATFTSGVGYDYGDLVLHRLEKDGGSPTDFHRGPTWHEPYNGSSVIRKHKGNDQLYFYVQCISANKPKVEYRAGDRIIPYEDLKEFLPKKRKPTNQGLAPDRTVEVRTFHLESVKRITIEKTTFLIEP